MEYQSPLGFNFRLKEPLTKNDNGTSAAEDKSLPNSFRLDTSRGPSFDAFNNSRQSLKRNFDSNRDRGFGFDRNKRNSPRTSWRGGNNRSISISDYYDPSMIENPWLELEQNKLKDSVE